MITVAVLEDRKKTAEIFNENGLNFNESSGCMQAVCGSDCLGYSLYSLDGDKIIIYKIYPLNDITFTQLLPTFL